MALNLYKPKIIEFELESMMYNKASDFLVDKILEIEADLGVVRLLLSGGQTPFPLYKRLADSSILPWENIEIYQSDERYVPENDDFSNQKRLKKTLDKTTAKCRELNLFNTSLPIEMTLKDYEERLESLDGIWFDQAILGIGADGHVASLFPGGDYLKHQDGAVIATTAPEEFEAKQRLSLTVESLLNSQDIMVLLTGAKKREVLSELLEGEKSLAQFPAKFLLTHPNVQIYCCFSEE